MANIYTLVHSLVLNVRVPGCTQRPPRGYHKAVLQAAVAIEKQEQQSHDCSVGVE